MMKNRNLKYRKRIKRRRLLLLIAFIIIIVVLILTVVHISKNKRKEQMPSSECSLIESEQSNPSPELTTEEKKQYVLDHKQEYTEDLISFMQNYNQVTDYVYNYKFKDVAVNKSCNDPIVQNGIPLYMQWDSRWGYEEYSGSLVGMAGCGPTCLTMVCNGLTKSDTQTVQSICKLCENDKQYKPGNGTSWVTLQSVATTIGLKHKEIPLSYSMMKKELENGHPIILNVSKGYFTVGGHYIVIAGIKDDKFIINDPNSKENSLKMWSFDDISSQIRNIWSFWIEN